MIIINQNVEYNDTLIDLIYYTRSVGQQNRYCGYFLDYSNNNIQLSKISQYQIIDQDLEQRNS